MWAKYYEVWQQVWPMLRTDIWGLPHAGWKSLDDFGVRSWLATARAISWILAQEAIFPGGQNHTLPENRFSFYCSWNNFEKRSQFSLLGGCLIQESGHVKLLWLMNPLAGATSARRFLVP